jgi:hypothetical protein
MDKGEAFWEKMCWNAGKEWIVEDKMWKRMWEGQKKPFKMETGDRGTIKVYPGRLICEKNCRGFLILNVPNPRTKEKDRRDFDVEIYCLIVPKGSNKDEVIRDMIRQVKVQYPGKRIWIRESKRSLIKRLLGEGFSVSKTTALGSSDLIMDVPGTKNKKRKREPTPVHLDKSEIIRI